MDVTLTLTLLTILVLLIVSAIFSASETGVVASSRAKIHRLEKEKDSHKNLHIMVFLQRNLGQVVSAILVVNSLINILATTLATGLFVRFFGETGIIYATIIMSALIIFYCEILPKILAIHYPEKTALSFARFLKVVFNLFKPVTKLLNFLAKATLKAIRIELPVDNKEVSVEDIRSLIDMQAGLSDDIQRERSMLLGILDLATVDVDEVMTHRKEVSILDIDLGSEEIIQRMLASPFTRVPIYQNDPENIIGVLHVKALFKALRKHRGSASKIDLNDIMSKPWFIPESTALLDQLQAFRKRREHFACVVDEYGSFSGVITLEDILEEIVGEINDEHDIEIPGVRVAPDGSIVVVGIVTIRELNRQFGWNLSDEEAVTIAGLLIHEAQKIPDVGQSYKINDLTIRVLRKHRNQITLLRIVKKDQKRADDA